MAATGGARSPMVVPTVISADPKVPKEGAYIQIMQLENIIEKDLLFLHTHVRAGGGGGGGVGGVYLNSRRSNSRSIKRATLHSS